MTERPLAPHEAAIAAAGVRLVLHSVVEGELDETVLAEALPHLRVSCPLIAGRITGAAPHGRPTVRIEEGTATPVLHRGVDFHEEINAPLDWDAGPLLRLAVLHEAGHSRIVMTLPRAFADGMSHLALHRRLWTLYSALATGGPVPSDVVRPVLGPALDDMLAARTTPGQLRDFVAERAAQDAQAPPALLPALASRDGGPGPDRSLRVLGVGADAERTARLVRQARGAGLTLNALVSGVLLSSLRARFPAADGPVRLLCTTAVDMRRRFTPSLPDDVLQSAATTTSLRLRIGHGAHPADIGRELAAQLRAALESGAAARELAAFPHMLDQQPPSLVITDVGVIAAPETAGGPRIRSVRMAPLGHVPMIFAVLSRYQGRLAIDLTYSRAWYTDAQIRELADGVSATLDELTAER
ncbi:phthiocerol/phthiodiolone dimycocerosyl transferase family protein [Streptomyces avicenniae]|uniref:phthiocerol/phthiodiolone dimycocerosyl transferase family protein n=1 Tax=Streptomyces avicenniae TaxID=500153 RepID=UPI00069A5DEC|nr:condensation protein [Streptomyces avicenniae]